MQFYTLDRLNSLDKYNSLGLWDISYEGISSAFSYMKEFAPDDCINVHMLDRFKEQFPGGLSLHGMRYLFSKYLKDNQSYYIELVYENVRAKYYAKAPSRFQSYFAFETRQQVNNFDTHFTDRNNKRTLWLVESDEFFKADMSLLNRGNSISGFIENAHSYWSGVIFDEQNVECLLPLP